MQIAGYLDRHDPVVDAMEDPHRARGKTGQTDFRIGVECLGFLQE